MRTGSVGDNAAAQAAGPMVIHVHPRPQAVAPMVERRPAAATSLGLGGAEEGGDSPTRQRWLAAARATARDSGGVGTDQAHTVESLLSEPLLETVLRGGQAIYAPAENRRRAATELLAMGISEGGDEAPRAWPAGPPGAPPAHPQSGLRVLPALDTSPAQGSPLVRASLPEVAHAVTGREPRGRWTDSAATDLRAAPRGSDALSLSSPNVLKGLADLSGPGQPGPGSTGRGSDGGSRRSGGWSRRDAYAGSARGSGLRVASTGEAASGSEGAPGTSRHEQKPAIFEWRTDGPAGRGLHRARVHPSPHNIHDSEAGPDLQPHTSIPELPPLRAQRSSEAPTVGGAADLSPSAQVTQWVRGPMSDTVAASSGAERGPVQACACKQRMLLIHLLDVV